MRFKDKTVLITGAGRNTGLGIARRFAEEGATVLVNDASAQVVDRAIAQLREAGHTRLIAAPADISNAAEVSGMFLAIRGQCERLDVLVGNAVVQGIGKSFHETTPEFFESVLRVNLMGTFHVAREAAILMVAQGGGAIVNIGSNVSRRAIRKRSAYVASKGGVDALTLAMAVDLAPHGIRVNTVAPGYIHTDRWDALSAKDVQRRRSNTPLGQEAFADDIAAAVLYLASDEAKGITGARLVVDGGCSAQLVPGDMEV